MAYWIIVASKDHNDPSVSGLAKWLKRKEDCFWGVKPNADNVNKITSGDKAFFYIAKPEMKLIGPIRIISSMHELKEGEKANLWTESLAFTPSHGFFFVANDEACGVCSVRGLIDNDELSFVSNKKNWGRAFNKTLVPIEISDYQAILRKMAGDPIKAQQIVQQAQLTDKDQ